MRVQQMRFRKEKPIELAAVKATSSRAIFAGKDQFPYILFTFKQEYGPDFEVTMSLREASAFVQKALNSISAATPDIPRAPTNRTWDQ